MTWASLNIFFYFLLTIYAIAGTYLSFHVNPPSLSWHIAVVGNLLLAHFVYSKDKKNLLNQTFAFLGLSVSLWCFAVYGLYLVPDATSAFRWSKLFLGMFFIPPTFFHFCLALTRDRRKRGLLYLSYALSVIGFLLNVSGLFVNEFVKFSWKYSPRITFPYTLWILNTGLWMFGGLFLVFKKYRKSESILERNQLKYFFLAAAVGAGASFTNPILSMGIKMYPTAGFASIFYTAIVTYAIVKHQLLDIRVVIARSIVYASLVVVITATYILTVGIFQGLLGTIRFAKVSFLVQAFTAMVIAAGFQPLRDRIRFSVDKLFFKEKYNPQKIFKELGSVLTSTIELDRLLNLFVQMIEETLHIPEVTLMLFDENTASFRTKITRGLNNKNTDEIYFGIDEFLSSYLIREGKVFVREEFELESQRTPSQAHSNPNSFRGIQQTLEKLGKMKATLSVPLKTKDKLIAILNLGNKKSEEMFTREDLELLSTIASQAAIAIENTRLYDEMRQLEKNLHRADKLSALGTLASSIAHEIKNPLVSIKTFTQLLPKKLNDPEFQEKYNTIVPQELERLENVLNELLDVARPTKETNKPLGIEKVLDEILLFMEDEIFKSKVEIIKEYHGNLPEITGNPDQWKQVFMNLILNGLQAMPAGGTLTIATKLQPQSLEIRLSDTGCGIPKENLPHLFKPFFSTREGGTGLGLTITRQIIREHGGNIEVQSQPNKGTVFLIRVPLPHLT